MSIERDVKKERERERQNLIDNAIPILTKKKKKKKKLMETYDRYKIIESALKQNWQRNVAEENSCMCDRNFVCVIISPQKWCVISVFTTNASYASPLFYLLSLSPLSFLFLSLLPPSLFTTSTYTHIHSLSLSLYSLSLFRMVNFVAFDTWTSATKTLKLLYQWPVKM